MARVTKAMTDVTRAWLHGKRKTSGDYATNGSVITFHGNEIVRKLPPKKAGMAFETSPGRWWTSISTRGALNTLLLEIYGPKAPQYVVKDGKLYLFDPSVQAMLTFSDIRDSSSPSGWSGGDLDEPSHGWIYWSIAF